MSFTAGCPFGKVDYLADEDQVLVLYLVQGKKLLDRRTEPVRDDRKTVPFLNNVAGGTLSRRW